MDCSGNRSSESERSDQRGVHCNSVGGLGAGAVAGLGGGVEGRWRLWTAVEDSGARVEIRLGGGKQAMRGR